MVEKTHTHRKWLPISLFPMHSHKKGHHSADKHALASSSAASSSSPTADPEIPWAKPPKKAPTLVRALFSKAKKHPHLRRAASLVEAHRHGRRRSSTLHSSRRSSADTPEDLPTRRWNIQRDYEVEIMQQKYDLIKLAFAGEFVRPVDESTFRKVVDVGCGPMGWTMDFAATHPDAHVYGFDCVDMSPQGSTRQLPPNCELVLHDCRKPLPLDEESVDLCVSRFMNVTLTADEYRQMIAHCWRVLKPGGYLEILEMDLIVNNAGPITHVFNQRALNNVQSHGLDPALARHLRTLLPPPMDTTQDALMTEVYRSLPIGLWGGRLGVLFRDDLMHSLQVVGIDMDNDSDRFENQLHAVEKELETYRSYANFHFLRVQKPPS